MYTKGTAKRYYKWIKCSALAIYRFLQTRQNRGRDGDMCNEKGKKLREKKKYNENTSTVTTHPDDKHSSD